MKAQSLSIVALPALFAFLLMVGPVRTPLPPPAFSHLLALIKPSAGEEQWARIPWLTSLQEARRRARALGRPILLWTMDGSPLACT